mmetsp:Transcript_37273/g.78607  ORF Transcript_37273/g.78607 Transcript_37273/m.78607 type:complete len:258 (+) Transcript_37273:207-980(+)
MMVPKTLFALLVTLISVTACSAFAPPCVQRGSPSIRSIRSIGSENFSNNQRCCHRDAHHAVLSAEKGGGGGGSDLNFDSFLSSLPSPEAVKENIMEGKMGERGELYVIAQFGLLLLIAIGSVPIIGDALEYLIGPSLIFIGLFLVYKGAADLQDNLSPWPIPADPKSGRGSLINQGIYSQIRHPMYTGLIVGMTGLSLVTDSVSRMLLTCLLYFVLDAKSEYEETELIRAYGASYKEYRREVPGKFLPSSINDLFAQ